MQLVHCLETALVIGPFEIATIVHEVPQCTRVRHSSERDFRKC